MTPERVIRHIFRRWGVTYDRAENDPYGRHLTHYGRVTAETDVPKSCQSDQWDPKVGGYVAVRFSSQCDFESFIAKALRA